MRHGSTAKESFHNPTHNPAVVKPNLVAGDPGSAAGTRAVIGKPAPVCADAGRCKECNVAASQVTVPPWEADLADEHVNVSAFLVLNENEFPCFYTRLQYLQAADNIDGIAGLLLGRDTHVHTVVDEEYEAPFPVFTIDTQCTSIFGDLDEGSWTYIATPSITDGNVSETHPGGSDAVDEMRVVPLVVTHPDSMEGLAYVGQSTHNPATAVPETHRGPSISGEVKMILATYVCSRWASCEECDGFSINVSSRQVRNKIAFFPFYRGSDINHYLLYRNANRPIENGVCLLPRADIMRELESMGALAVVFGNAENDVFTYNHNGWQQDVTLPAFNVPRNVSDAWYNFLVNDYVYGEPHILRVALGGDAEEAYYNYRWTEASGGGGGGVGEGEGNEPTDAMRDREFATEAEQSAANMAVRHRSSALDSELASATASDGDAPAARSGASEAGAIRVETVALDAGLEREVTNDWMYKVVLWAGISSVCFAVTVVTVLIRHFKNRLEEERQERIQTIDLAQEGQPGGLHALELTSHAALASRRRSSGDSAGFREQDGPYSWGPFSGRHNSDPSTSDPHNHLLPRRNVFSRF